MFKFVGGIRRRPQSGGELTVFLEHTHPMAQDTLCPLMIASLLQQPQWAELPRAEECIGQAPLQPEGVKGPQALPCGSQGHGDHFTATWAKGHLYSEEVNLPPVYVGGFPPNCQQSRGVGSPPHPGMAGWRGSRCF